MASVNSVVEWKWRYIPRNVRVWVARDGFYLQWSGRAGYVYSARWVPWPLGPISARRQLIMSTVWEGPMKRKAPGSMKSLQRHVEPDKLLSAYPSLCEFLTAAVYEGEDERRESPTVTLWASGGEWKATVKDRAEGLVMWLSASTLRELLKLMETFCLAEDGPWRHDEHAHERNGKRVKKSS